MTDDQLAQSYGFQTPNAPQSSNSSIDQLAQSYGFKPQTPSDATSTQNNTPTDVSKALNPDLPTNPNTGDKNYNGWCQAFVEQMTGSGWKGNSAADAWNSYAQSGKAVAGTQGMKPGDLIYFSPNDSNGNAGHTGIYMGNDKFVSATYGGVQPNDLTEWQQKYAPILGYVPQGGTQ